MFFRSPAANRRQRGAYFEQQALRFLRRKGLSLVERNFNCRFGEIDLIMLDKDQLVFVEVRFRASDRFGSPLHSVTPAKQSRIRKAAALFLQTRRALQGHDCRFDVIGIEEESRADMRINWVKNAFY